MDNAMDIAGRMIRRGGRRVPKLEELEADLAAAEYIQALRSGQRISSEFSMVLQGSRAKWDSFDWAYHPDLVKARPVVLRWWRERFDAGGGLVLAGNTGCGKTHLAEAVAEACGPLVRFWYEPELIEAIQASYGKFGWKGLSENDILTDIRQAHLFVLDDVGAAEVKNTGWLQAIYQKVFNQRLERGRPVLVTSNLPFKAGQNGKSYSPLCDRLGIRAFDRLIGQCTTPEMFYYVDLFRVPSYRTKDLVRAQAETFSQKGA